MSNNPFSKTPVIVDMDNCLVNDDWRLPLIAPQLSGHARYHQYHMNSALDQEWDLDLWDLFATNHVCILTARPEEYRTITQNFLWRTMKIRHPYILLMRAADDFDSSPAFKRRQVAKLKDLYGIDTASISIAVDDREDVVAMYRELGITARVHALHSIPYPSCVLKSGEQS